MPSKGVQVYSYIAVTGCSIEFSVPGTNLVRKIAVTNLRAKNIEMRAASRDNVEMFDR